MYDLGQAEPNSSQAHINLGWARENSCLVGLSLT